MRYTNPRLLYFTLLTQNQRMGNRNKGKRHMQPKTAAGWLSCSAWKSLPSNVLIVDVHEYVAAATGRDASPAATKLISIQLRTQYLCRQSASVTSWELASLAQSDVITIHFDADASRGRRKYARPACVR